MLDAYQVRMKPGGKTWYGMDADPEVDFDVMPFKPEPQAKPNAGEFGPAPSDPYVTPPAGTTGGDRIKALAKEYPTRQALILAVDSGAITEGEGIDVAKLLGIPVN